MQPEPTLYDLYEQTSFRYWERQITENIFPTAEQLAALIEAHAAEPLPVWVNPLIAKGLRGELKGRAGRPKETPRASMRFAVASRLYHKLLPWLRKREARVGLVGWSAVRGKDWWSGPPSERAARIATAKWLPHMSWRSFLNRLSSQR